MTTLKETLGPRQSRKHRNAPPHLIGELLDHPEHARRIETPCRRRHGAGTTSVAAVAELVRERLASLADFAGSGGSRMAGRRVWRTTTWITNASWPERQPDGYKTLTRPLGEGSKPKTFRGLVSAE